MTVQDCPGHSWTMKGCPIRACFETTCPFFWTCRSWLFVLLYGAFPEGVTGGILKSGAFL